MDFYLDSSPTRSSAASNAPLSTRKSPWSRALAKPVGLSLLLGLAVSLPVAAQTGAGPAERACPPGSTERVWSSSLTCIPPGCPDDPGLWTLLDWQDEHIEVPKFNGNLGNLTEIKLEFAAEIDGIICLENLNTTNGCQVPSWIFDVPFVVESDDGLNDPDLDPDWPLTGIALGDSGLGFQLGPGDGILNCIDDTGSGGVWTTHVHDSGTFEVLIDDTSPLFERFIKSGSTPDTVSFDVSTSGGWQGGGCSSAAFIPDVRARMDLKVFYTYCTNAPPQCVSDYASTDEDLPVNIPVLTNDSDVDGEIVCSSLEIVVGMEPLHGTAIVSPGCQDGWPCVNCFFTYTPDAGYCGPDTFWYRVQDDLGAWMEPCEVTIDVFPVNEAPIAIDDLASTDEGVPAMIAVCANDQDPDNGEACGCPLECPSVAAEDLVITQQPDCGGTAVSMPNGSVLFTPPVGFCGSCVFWYKIRDNCPDSGDELFSNEAKVTVTVLAVNQAPVAENDTESTDEGVPVIVTILGNDWDPDDTDGCGCPLDKANTAVTITQQPDCGGTATVLGNKKIRFDPPADFCGDCVFRYTITDTCGLLSNEATVTVTVIGVNEAPVAVDDMESTDEGTPVIIDILGNDWDPDDADGCGCPLDKANTTVTITQQPDCGATVIVLGNKKVRFVPPAGFCGACEFRYTIVDTCGLPSNEATVTVTILEVNEPPVAEDDSGSTDQGVSVDITVLTNDSDPDDTDGCGCPLDKPTAPITITQQPDCGGTATVLGNQKVRFAPPADFCGECVFEYTIKDVCGLESAPALVTVTVHGTNLPPDAVMDSATTDEDLFVDIHVCANDSDPDSGTGCGEDIDCDSVVIISHPSCGGVAEPTGGGWVRFTPPPDWCGVCTFRYEVFDFGGLSDDALVRVTVDGVNDPPDANDDVAHTAMDIPVDINVCENDTDVDNAFSGDCGCILVCPNNPTVEIVSWDSSCSASEPVVDPITGVVTFTPTPGYVGDCMFRYRIWDTDEFGVPCLSDEADVIVHISDPCIEIDTRNPASLLIYPEFDNRDGIISILTVTNTGDLDVDAHFVYRDEEDCQEFDRTEMLTGYDTLTLITNDHNPGQDRGYVYVYALCPASGEAVAYNHLIGNLMVVDGLDAFSCSMNPWSVLGVGYAPDPECPSMWLTDADGDGRLDLDTEAGEYENAPDEILIPRFFGQTPDRKSDLIVIDLTGGPAFTTVLDFEIFNDNEEAFSAEHSFNCWDRISLSDLSGVFDQDFLAGGTNHDPGEIMGQNTTEAGWMRIDGDIAFSSVRTIDDPAFLAVLIESVMADRYVADLPFFRCSQDNGALLPRTHQGDTD
jgi:hypothetical protein